MAEEGAPHIAQEKKKQLSLETRSGFTERIQTCTLLMQEKVQKVEV